MNTLTIHVWYIYLHLVNLYVCKYTIHGSYGNGIECFIFKCNIYHLSLCFQVLSEIANHFWLALDAILTYYIHLQHQVLSCTRGSPEFLIHTTNSRWFCFQMLHQFNSGSASIEGRSTTLFSGERGKEPDNGQRVWRPSSHRQKGVEKSHRDIKKKHTFNPHNPNAKPYRVELTTSISQTPLGGWTPFPRLRLHMKKLEEKDNNIKTITADALVLFWVDHGSKCFQPETMLLTRLDTANSGNPCTGALLNA